MHILVVEDETRLREQLRDRLRERGHVVDVAADGLEGLYYGEEYPLDLAVIDIGLPGLSGIELIRRLRLAERNFPILILTARGNWQDKVNGLETGADDYLVKPFALRELQARVRTLLRRDSDQTDSVFRVGDLTLDTAKHSAQRSGTELELTAKEFALLRYFMTHPGDVLSQEHLLEHVWDENADPFTNTVRVTVGTLRRKLAVGGDEDPVIETVVGSGYRLVAGAS